LQFKIFDSPFKITIPNGKIWNISYSITKDGISYSNSAYNEGSKCYYLKLYLGN